MAWYLNIPDMQTLKAKDCLSDLVSARICHSTWQKVGVPEMLNVVARK